MPVGKIIIKGVIGSYTDQMGQLVKGIELIDIVSQIHASIDCESLEVEIDSPGGDCDLGYQIHDLLRAQKKPITTIITGECCSIATVILFAGDIRLVSETGKPPMIHNPWVIGVTGDADDIALAAEDMRAEEDKLIDFYHKNTGVNKASLDSLMKQETYLTLEQAQQFNFLTKPTSTVKALAFKKDTSMSKVLLAKVNAIALALGIGKQKVALSATASDGTVLEIDSVDDMPDVGNAVTIGGAPAPDGSYILPDQNMTVIVAGGVITEIADLTSDPNEGADEEMMAQNLALKEENEKLKAELAEAKETEKEVEKTLALVQKTLASDYVPAKRAQSFGRQSSEPVKKTVAQEKEEKEKRKAEYKK